MDTSRFENRRGCNFSIEQRISRFTSCYPWKQRVDLQDFQDHRPETSFSTSKPTPSWRKVDLSTCWATSHSATWVNRNTHPCGRSIASAKDACLVHSSIW